MEEKKKPIIRCFCVPAPESEINRTGDDVIAYAIDEEGHTLSSHYCSSDDWAKVDIQHECHFNAYYKRYPEGFETVWLGHEVPADWNEDSDGR